MAKNFILPILLAASVLLSLSATAQETGDDTMRHAVEAAVEKAIVPGYRSLVEAAAEQSVSMDLLCNEPGQARLAEARSTFANLVTAWSRVELIRFGPVRTENRFEKLFFWPDRRGRGLRQVQGLIAEQDATATNSDSLRAKSVAVQGLPALEYVLFGKGSDGLAADGQSEYRCHYGRAISEAIEANTGAVLAGWAGREGYGALMVAAGPDNRIYRSPREALQELLRAIAEQLQINAELKLIGPLGLSAGKAKPKRLPFWRSNLSFLSILASTEAVREMHDLAKLSTLLPESSESLADSLDFETRQVLNTLNELIASGESVVDQFQDESARKKLRYATIPMSGARAIVAERYPEALGLSLGFNSLDGD